MVTLSDRDPWAKESIFCILVSSFSLDPDFARRA